MLIGEAVRIKWFVIGLIKFSLSYLCNWAFVINFVKFRRKMWFLISLNLDYLVSWIIYFYLVHRLCLDKNGYIYVIVVLIVILYST